MDAFRHSLRCHEQWETSAKPNVPCRRTNLLIPCGLQEYQHGKRQAGTLLPLRSSFGPPLGIIIQTLHCSGRLCCFPPCDVTTNELTKR